METKTYKFIKSIAFAIFIVAAIFFIVAITNLNAGTAIMSLKSAIGCIISGSLFLVFAKIIEQNEVRNKQNEQLNKLLTEQLNRIHMTLKNIDRSMDA